MLAVIKHVVDDNIICLSAKFSDTAHACASAWCVHHSSTAVAQNFISPELWPQQATAELN